MVFVIQELGPVLASQLHAAHEPLGPVIRVGNAVVVLEQQRQKHITGLQGIGNGGPMAHDEIQEIFELLLAREGLLISHLASPNLG
jgi:hypothetical protein